MTKIGLDELKEIQLQILKYLHDYCVENKLMYFLAGGTLIGAVRHHGYIPWDDDIDIMLPRRDYDELIKKFNAKNGRYKIYCPENYDSYCLPYAKICDENTILKEQSGAFKGRDFGINIDVFPLDCIPDDDEIKDRLLKKITFYRNVLELKNIKLSSDRSFKRNFILAAGKAATVFIPHHYAALKISTLIKHEKGPTKQRACLVGAYGRREILDSDVFNETQLADFEGYQFYILKRYDDYLSSLYGDYMKLPDEEKRVSHHKFEAYWLEGGR